MIANIMCRYSLFADYSNISISAKNIELLLREFNDEKMIPEKINGTNTLGQMIPYIHLSSEDDSSFIDVLPERIDVTYISKRLDGFSESEYETIQERIPLQINKLYSAFHNSLQDSNRLAWYTEYVFFDIKDEEMLGFRNRFLKEQISFIADPSDEFSARYVWKSQTEICGRKEEINLLATVNRHKQQFGMTPVDGYKISFDINTFWENKKNRFNADSSTPYIRVARDYQLKLQEDILGEYI